MESNEELFGAEGISKLEPLTILPKTEQGKPPEYGLRVYSKADQEEIDKELNRLLDSGYISPSKTPFTSPFMVSRNSGKIRLCVYQWTRKNLLCPNWRKFRSKQR
jgi:hypothetical protein